MYDITTEFWTIFVLFVCALAISTAYVRKQTGDKNSPGVYVTRGVVEILFVILLVAVVGEELERYWDRFSFDHVSRWIDRSLECFLGGIMVVAFGIGGVVDLIIGFARKGKE